MKHRKYILKSISWRILGTIDTILLSWVISGNLNLGLTIGGIELVTKLLLFYFHEIIWDYFN
jgi:uncharacterized membrane protein